MSGCGEQSPLAFIRNGFAIIDNPDSACGQGPIPEYSIQKKLDRPRHMFWRLSDNQQLSGRHTRENWSTTLLMHGRNCTGMIVICMGDQDRSDIGNTLSYINEVI
jgi:hypothetical protein